MLGKGGTLTSDKDKKVFVDNLKLGKVGEQSIKIKVFLNNLL